MAPPILRGAVCIHKLLAVPGTQATPVWASKRESGLDDVPELLKLIRCHTYASGNIRHIMVPATVARLVCHCAARFGTGGSETKGFKIVSRHWHAGSWAWLLESRPG